MYAIIFEANAIMWFLVFGNTLGLIGKTDCDNSRSDYRRYIIPLIDMIYLIYYVSILTKTKLS